MALDPRKRQKKLERKKAKDKARQKALAVRQAFAVAHKFDRAARGPIIDAFVTSVVWDEGIGHVVLARDLGNDRVAYAAFLVDIYCLGVKNAFCCFGSRDEYAHKLRNKITEDYEIEVESPEFVRKLVEDAVAYARSIGFEPHPDYQEAKAIFGDIDASACTEEFEFGREGKPFFVSGPHDSLARSKSIVRTLNDHCGEGNFDYVLQLSERDLAAEGLSRFVLPQE